MKTRLIIIDDEEDVRPLFEQALADHLNDGLYSMHFASGAELGWKLFLENPAAAVVITDLKMPGTSGMELLGRIVERTRLTPVIIMSAFGDMPNIRKAMNLGAHDFLIKPLDLADLRSTVLHAVQEHSVEQQKELTFQMRLRQAQMGELLSMIAHQWRQPLSVITMTASMERANISAGISTPASIEATLREVETQAMFMSETIRDFQGLYAKDRPPDTVDLKQVIERVLHLMSSVLTGVTVDVNVEASGDFCSYGNDLLQVLIALTQNATDEFRDRSIQKPRIQIDVKKDADRWVITFEDNAGGIRGDHINEIFTPAFSTKTEGKGSGIGLHMSKLLIENRCKGDLGVRNGSAGAVFTISIPTLRRSTHGA